jgi:hypothetical protein
MSFVFLDLTGDGTNLIPMPADLSNDPEGQAAFFAEFHLTTPPAAPAAEPPALAADEETAP